jgi:hypothetical protein
VSKPGRGDESAYKQSVLDKIKNIISGVCLSDFRAIKRQVKLADVFPFRIVEQNK